MTLEKKILVWSMVFKSIGTLTAISFIQDSKLWTAIFGVLLVVSSEMKDYYMKQNVKHNEQ